MIITLSLYHIHHNFQREFGNSPLMSHFALNFLKGSCAGSEILQRVNQSLTVVRLTTIERFQLLSLSALHSLPSAKSGTC